MATFEDFNLDPQILRALEEMKYLAPSNIQAETIPLIQKGRDLIALAETGSGKTAACAIPICDRVDVTKKHIQALIIVPTRELALQYATETQKIGKYKKVATFAVYGGADADLQEAKLKHSVQVCVATPGRLIDFIYQRLVDLSYVETLILDEADEMLSMGFFDDLDFIMRCLVHEHQTLLFSATMPSDIRRIAKDQMKDPLEVSLTAGKRAPLTIKHFFSYCKENEKNKVLLQALANHQPKQAIVFCTSRIQCEKLSSFLQKEIEGVDFLHGGLGQNIRTTITSKFRQGKVKYLIATDVAARGLDFSGVTHVIMYQLPKDPDTYLHRSGRTGRFGCAGMTLSLVTNRDIQTVRRIAKHLGRNVQWDGAAPRNFQDSENSTTHKTPIEKTGTKRTSTDRPATKRPATKRSATERSATERPVTQESVKEKASPVNSNKKVFRMIPPPKELVKITPRPIKRDGES
ncbi:MAG: ATP-dependent RNA helicase DeaD [Chlamydiales bacterium]|jgi:ATP-dependent RNA helicase DeaD